MLGAYDVMTLDGKKINLRLPYIEFNIATLAWKSDMKMGSIDFDELTINKLLDY